MASTFDFAVVQRLHMIVAFGFRLIAMTIDSIELVFGLMAAFVEQPMQRFAIDVLAVPCRSEIFVVVY